MKFTVTIRNNETGEIKIHHDTYDWEDNNHGEYFTSAFEGFTYQWTEGNFGCDCNRAIFMYGYDKEQQRSCTSGLFDIIKIVDESGNEYSTDGFNRVINVE